MKKQDYYSQKLLLPKVSLIILSVLSITLTLPLFVTIVYVNGELLTQDFSQSETNNQTLNINASSSNSAQINCSSKLTCLNEFSPNSICYNNTCECADGFLIIPRSSNNTCISRTANIDVKPEHILPIMAVMGVMFIGICIAMNLFSKSMNGKQRSGAFVVASRGLPLLSQNQSNVSRQNYVTNANQSLRQASQPRRTSSQQPMTSRQPTPVPGTVISADVDRHMLRLTSIDRRVSSRSQSRCSSRASTSTNHQQQSQA